MSMKQDTKPWLSADQVHALNEKHGWFEYGDAQSAVSQAFANDAIEMHERIRAAAPDLLDALRQAESLIDTLALACLDRVDSVNDRRRAAITSVLSALEGA